MLMLDQYCIENELPRFVIPAQAGIQKVYDCSGSLLSQG